MPREPAIEEVFLQIGFNSPESDGSLRTIEMFGVPGERLKNGKCVVSEKAQRFFDDLIVRRIFRESRRLPDCNFEYLKIWLYDTEIGDDERGFVVPKVDSHDLDILSTVRSSRLERIYVLDNGLKGLEYERWKRTVEDLFVPLFSEFIAPPKPPSRLSDNPFVKLVTAMTEGVIGTVDEYSKMKQSLFFNALIIQID